MHVDNVAYSKERHEMRPLVEWLSGLHRQAPAI